MPRMNLKRQGDYLVHFSALKAELNL